MLVINLLGGPGSGKSTLAAAIFAHMKMLGINCELVSEYAKDLVWDGATAKLANQMLITGTQLDRLERLRGKVDVAISDSPILLGIVYSQLSGWGDGLKAEILRCFHTFDNRVYVVSRDKPYTEVGRVQTEAEAVSIDESVVRLLSNEGIRWTPVSSSLATAEAISRDIAAEIRA